MGLILNYDKIPTYQKVLLPAVFLGAVIGYFAVEKRTIERARAVRVVDNAPDIKNGDTIILRGRTVRVLGMFAPDASFPPFRDASKEILQSLASRDGGISCSVDFVDTALRRDEPCSPPANTVRELHLPCVFLGNRASVAATMVAQGYAVDHRRYSGGAYEQLMKEAAAQRRGLWSVDYNRMAAIANNAAKIPLQCR